MAMDLIGQQLREYPDNLDDLDRYANLEVGIAMAMIKRQGGGG